MSIEFKNYEDKMDKSIEALRREFLGLRTGRASPTLLEPISVEAYGGKVPINQVGNISVPESRLVTVQVWDETLIQTVEKAIRNSDLGLNPMIEGNTIRVPIPELSEERRLEIAKIASKYAEDAKITIRNIRRDAMDQIKNDEKNKNISKDDSFQFSENMQNRIPGADKDPKYQATGISIVIHPKSPLIPSMHFNTRYIKTSSSWFGGGMDATPSYKDLKEKKMIHDELKKVCIQNKKNYKKYKKWCDEYFYLPHRNEARGIGGIFFDYETKDWIKNFKFVRELGLAFIDISNKVINRKKKLKYSKKDKEKQLIKRGRYVEFNLLYDRGTKFGLNSGGNIDSILMSLPPEAKWK